MTSSKISSSLDHSSCDFRHRPLLRASGFLRASFSPNFVFSSHFTLYLCVVLAHGNMKNQKVTQVLKGFFFPSVQFERGTFWGKKWPLPAAFSRGRRQRVISFSFICARASKFERIIAGKTNLFAGSFFLVAAGKDSFFFSHRRPFRPPLTSQAGPRAGSLCRRPPFADGFSEYLPAAEPTA